MTYLATGTVAEVVDGPTAGSEGATAAVVGTFDVRLEDSVFFKTVFILMSSFFPTLLTLSSRPSAGVPPTLEAMSIEAQIWWPWSQIDDILVSLEEIAWWAALSYFMSSRSRYTHDAGRCTPSNIEDDGQWNHHCSWVGEKVRNFQRSPRNRIGKDGFVKS